MSKIRWGLIGCGDIAQKRVAPALRDLPHSEIVSVNRAQSDLAEAFAKQFGARKWFSDWRELLADDEINAVYIATPVYLHAEQTIAAAEAGKHVLCEKPMAMNVRECDEMIAACRANNVKLGIAYYRHFYPIIERIKAIIESGEIGEPVMAQVNAFEWFNPPQDHPRAWLIKGAQSGGGPMMDFGCHRIEVLLNILGPITRVAGMTARVLFERDVEDTAAALFQFERGTCGILSITHATPLRDTIDIFGSKGSLHVPLLNDGRLLIKTDTEERWESHPPAANFHQPLIADFIEAVLADRDSAVDGELGKRVATIEAAIYDATCKEIENHEPKKQVAS